MKRYILIFFYYLSFVSCDNTVALKLKEREAALQQKETSLQEKENKINESKAILAQTQAENVRLKYAYVIITVNKPEITSSTEDINKAFRETALRLNRENTSLSVPPMDIPEPILITTHNASPHIFTYTSDIIDVNNVTEDYKYRIMDNYQNSLERALKTEDELYSLKVNYKRISTIEKREYKIFDSYAEASISKNK